MEFSEPGSNTQEYRGTNISVTAIATDAEGTEIVRTVFPLEIEKVDEKAEGETDKGGGDEDGDGGDGEEGGNDGEGGEEGAVVPTDQSDREAAEAQCRELEERSESLKPLFSSWDAVLTGLEDQIQFIKSAPIYANGLIEIGHILKTAEKWGAEVVELRTSAEALALQICELLDAIHKSDDEAAQLALFAQMKPLIASLEQMGLKSAKRTEGVANLYLYLLDKVNGWEKLVERYRKLLEERNGIDVAGQRAKEALEQLIASALDATITSERIDPRAEGAAQLLNCLDPSEIVDARGREVAANEKRVEEIDRQINALRDHLFPHGEGYVRSELAEFEALRATILLFNDVVQQRTEEGRLCFDLGSTIADKASSVTVPDLVGQSLDVAKKALGDLGLSYAVVAGNPAPDRNAEHRVESQDPLPGTNLKRGSAVKLVIFGPYLDQRVMVPSVIGMKIPEARARLHEEGLDVKFLIGNLPKSEREALRAYNQEPSAGTRMAEGRTQVLVTLYGQYQQEEIPPVEGASEEVPFYVAFRLYFPEISSDKSLKKEERLSVFDRMTPENARFISQDIKFYFYIEKEALKKFPKRYFEPGARMAATLSFELKAQERQGPLTIHGALLMEVAGTYASKEELLSSLPEKERKAALEKMSPNVLNVATEDGRFFKRVQEKDGFYDVHGQGFFKGWSREMKQKNIDLTKSIVAMFDCVIATTLFEDRSAEPLKKLRVFRDRVLMRSDAGRKLIRRYYANGPAWALWIADHPTLKPLLKWTLEGISGWLAELAEDERVRYCEWIFDWMNWLLPESDQNTPSVETYWKLFWKIKKLEERDDGL
ncbi:MAG: PASTA domain-containing protein [Chlamydiia bacterium]|nr:PASTA domain-containing protein [Chlamydiia bacterium]